MDLKEKTISGLFWEFIKNFGTQFSSLIVGIILARILTPRDFGLIGMLTVFIAVSNIFINSGFKEALIQKKECTEKDYATIFYFNAGVSFFIYLILFFCAGLIGDFYDEPRLEVLVKVLSIELLINALTFVQRTRLAKEMDFKLLTQIDIIANISSGTLAIGAAVYGLGVWSLVIKSLTGALVSVVLFWLWSNWKPSERFSKESFKELFSFGSRLMALGIIDTVYSNAYYLIIGKFYSAAQLGHYTKAKGFQNLPTSTITNIFRTVSYPALSSIQDDPSRLKSVYRRVLKSTMLVTLVLILGLAAIAEDFTVLLIGEEWRLAGEYLRLLCFAGIFYPANALNSNIMKVLGRSDLVLNLGIVTKFLAVPVILVAIFVDIKTMLWSMIVLNICVFYLNSHYGGSLINYRTFHQLKDFYSSLFVSLGMYLVITLIGVYVEIPLLQLVSLQVLIGAVFAIGVFELLALEDYRYIKSLIIERLKKLK